MRRIAGLVVLVLLALPLAGCDEACGRKDITRYKSDGSIDKCVTTHDDPQPHWSQVRGPR